MPPYVALIPLEWVEPSKNDLSAMPSELKHIFGLALFEAQCDQRSPDAKPLKGDLFKGSGVLEIVDDFDGNTYRAVYTVRFAEVIYVLHAFQKRSKAKIETPQFVIDTVISRLATAKQHYYQTYRNRQHG